MGFEKKKWLEGKVVGADLTEAAGSTGVSGHVSTHQGLTHQGHNEA